MKPLPIPLLPVALIATLTPLFAATYEWTAGGDGTSIYQEANWTLNGDGATAIPQIDPNVAINHDLVVTGGTPGGSGGGSAHLRLGSSGSLALSGGTFRLSQSGSAGIHADGTIGGARTSVDLSGPAVLFLQFFGDQDVTVAGSSTITLYGGGNPINNSGIALAASWTGQIHFLAETVSAATGEHLSKITVDGSPAVIGTNVELVSDGGSGSILTAAADGDGDGMLDNWEIQFFGNTSRDGTDDFDGDGLDDLDEFLNETDPTVKDSDGDSLWDGPEVTAGTDPNDPDSDDDGLNDNVETDTDVFVSATDTGTDPLDPNSDGDRIKDGGEVQRGTDPNNPAEYPDLPNVIFILADDLGVGEIGAYGQTKIVTPALDALATEGMRFDAFYSPSAVCAPTRGQLLAGKHSGQAHIRNNGEVGSGYQRPLPAGTFTLGTLMQNAGYATSCIGKWGLGGPGTTGEPLDQGFDHFFGYLGQVQAHHYYPSRLARDRGEAYYSPTLATQKGSSVDVAGAVNETGFDNLTLSLANKNNNGNVHSHDAMTEEALEWITAHQSEAFFMYLAFPIPHVSVQAPGHIDDLTDADGIVFNNAVRTCVDEFYPGQPFGAPIAHGGSGHYSATADKRHEYAAMISAMDRDIGRIRTLLESLNLDDDTLIIFTSDNGVTFLGEVDRAYFNSAAGLRGYKGNLYEGGIRAPFVAWWPGRIPAGTSSDILGNFDDVMPTLGELTETPCNPDTTGRSILPTLLDQPAECQEPKDYVYHEFSEGSNWTRTVRKGDWKLRRTVNKTSGAASYELYNLASDPAEGSNVYGANPTIAGELERIMDGDHSPAEFFFRPTDEFAQTNGVTVSYGTLGLRLNGTGEGVSPLLEDVAGKVTFKLTLDHTGGANSNGAFLFGSGDIAANLVRAEVDSDANLLRLSHGGDSATAPLGAAGPFDLEITWDPATSTATLVHGASTLPLILTSPPAVIDHVGYAVTNAQTDFSPVRVCLDLPALPLSFNQGIKNGNLTYSYQRPTGSGTYTTEQSTNLVDWSPATLLYEQAFTDFGGIQDVTLSLPDPASNPASPPALFHRVRLEP